MARGSPHWERFVEDLPWFFENRAPAVAGDLTEPGAFQLPDDLAERLPNLAELLGEAFTTAVSIGAEEHVLFSWEGIDGIASWLSPRPTPTPSPDILPVHGALLQVFGGIVERSNEPGGHVTEREGVDVLDTPWLLNTYESLTAQEATHDASFLVDYAWAFEEAPGHIPIDMAAYYSISREANFNTTLCHRRGGDVLLFAPDHSFEAVTPLEGCPEYTLYRRTGGETFIAWVETVAGQWMDGIGWERTRRSALASRDALVAERGRFLRAPSGTG